MYFWVFSPRRWNYFTFKFFCYFLYDKLIIIVTSIMKNYRNFFKRLMLQIRHTTCSIFIFPCIMIMVFNFTNIFITLRLFFLWFIFKFFFTNLPNFCIFIWLMLHFHVAKSLHPLLKIQKTFSYNFYLCMLVFYVFKWWYCRHWKTWRNMSMYFCCRWIGRIIFTSINLFYKNIWDLHR